MKLVTDPYAFKSGDMLDPADLNQVWRHAAEAVTDTFSRRYKEVPVVLSFTKTAATGYTNSDSAEVRQFRFRPPHYLFISEAFLNGNITSDNKVQITIKDAFTGQTPAGCTLPWLEVDSTGGVAADVSDVNPAQFQLFSEEYIIEIVPLGTMTVNTLDLVFFVRSDIHFAAGADVAPVFLPTLVSDSSSLDASVQSANKIAFEAACTPILPTLDYIGTPICFTVHGINLNLGALSTRQFNIPTFYGTNVPGLGRAQQKALQLSLWWKAPSARPVGETIEVQLYWGLNLIASAVDAIAGTARDSGFIYTSTFSLTDLLYWDILNASTDKSRDFYVRFVSSGAFNVEKAFGVLWVG